jgi:hypothetical protein
MRRTAPRSPHAFPGGPWRLLEEALPLLWLALVLGAYAVLALYPLHPTRAPVPGIAEADRAALPLLVAVLAAGIIAYLRRRRARAPAPASRHASENPATSHDD